MTFNAVKVEKSIENTGQGRTDFVSLTYGFVKLSTNPYHYYISITDGTFYIYLDENDEIKVVYSEPRFDETLLDQKLTFFSDREREDNIVKGIGAQAYQKILKQLVEYFFLFKDTMINTQFARTNLTMEEIKECTDAIFQSDAYKTMDLNTPSSVQQLYEMQCREYLKRDEMFWMLYAVDQGALYPGDLTYNIKVEIIKPIKFNHHYTQELFSERYAGGPGDIIFMSEVHVPYFKHNGFVKYAHDITSGEAVSGAQLKLEGWTLCSDKNMWHKYEDYTSTSIVVTDPNGNNHLLYRTGNDWFTYGKQI